jgi:hypothetical protein
LEGKKYNIARATVSITIMYFFQKPFCDKPNASLHTRFYIILCRRRGEYNVYNSLFIITK